MANVYIEARPKGRPEGSHIDDYVVEDHADLIRVGRTGTLGITPLGILCPYLFFHIILSSCLSQIAKYVFRRR